MWMEERRRKLSRRRGGIRSCRGGLWRHLLPLIRLLILMLRFSRRRLPVHEAEKRRAARRSFPGSLRPLSLWDSRRMEFPDLLGIRGRVVPFAFFSTRRLQQYQARRPQSPQVLGVTEISRPFTNPVGSINPLLDLIRNPCTRDVLKLSGSVSWTSIRLCWLCSVKWTGLRRVSSCADRIALRRDIQISQRTFLVSRLAVRGTGRG